MLRRHGASFTLNVKQIWSPWDKTLAYHQGIAFIYLSQNLKKLIQLNYKNAQDSSTASTSAATTDNVQVTETDRDILHYIGGSIIHSIKKKISPNQPSKESHHDILQCFICTDKPAAVNQKKTLTELFDRGGLTYVKPSVVDFLEHLERNFRDTFDTVSSSCTGDAFVKQCLNNQVLTSTFYQLCYDCEADDIDK